MECGNLKQKPPLATLAQPIQTLQNNHTLSCERMFLSFDFTLASIR